MPDFYNAAGTFGTHIQPNLYGPNLRDGSVGPFYRETVTSGFPVITTDHAYVHEGIAYVFSGSQEVAGSGTYSVAFTTPEDRYIHLKPSEVSANGGPVTVTFVEGPTFTGGTAVTPTNKNRITENTADTVVMRGVTPTGGAIIDTLYIAGATTGANRFGASSEAEEEFVLAQDTVYVFNFSNAAAAAVTCGWRVFFYEEVSS